MESNTKVIGQLQEPLADWASMTKYQSHKIVYAEKIIGIEQGTTPGANDWHINTECAGADLFVTHRVPHSWYAKHQPQVGGYLVVYHDGGYVSYSPAEPFEAGYTVVNEDAKS